MRDDIRIGVGSGSVIEQNPVMILAVQLPSEGHEFVLIVKRVLADDSIDSEFTADEPQSDDSEIVARLTEVRSHEVPITVPALVPVMPKHFDVALRDDIVEVDAPVDPTQGVGELLLRLAGVATKSDFRFAGNTNARLLGELLVRDDPVDFSEVRIVDALPHAETIKTETCRLADLGG